MNNATRFGAVLARTRARGVSLITAVFLVVVLAGLTAVALRVTLVQHATASMDMLGVQAYQAARSGLEWGIFQQLRVQPASATPVACFASPQTFAMPSDGSLRNFTVTVSCTAKSGNTVGDTTNRWTIVAVACNIPNGAAGCPNATTNVEYVQRRVQAELN
jgi:MSHA biogenesis protein MshP